MNRKHYPTIVLSDIHLGSEHSHTEEVIHFLQQVDCNRLILNTWYGRVHYLNSGAWVESLTALVEHEDGEWKILPFQRLNLYATAV